MVAATVQAREKNKWTNEHAAEILAYADKHSIEKAKKKYHISSRTYYKLKENEKINGPESLARQILIQCSRFSEDKGLSKTTTTKLTCMVLSGVASLLPIIINIEKELEKARGQLNCQLELVKEKEFLEQKIKTLEAENNNLHVKNKTLARERTEALEKMEGVKRLLTQNSK